MLDTKKITTILKCFFTAWPVGLETTISSTITQTTICSTFSNEKPANRPPKETKRFRSKTPTIDARYMRKEITSRYCEFRTYALASMSIWEMCKLDK